MIKEAEHWSDTFQLDWGALGKPIGPITEECSWDRYMGRPLKQREPATCVLLSCTTAIVAVHCLQHDGLHGEVVWAHPKHPDNWLLDECRHDGIWTLKEGAFAGKVLAKILQLGGVPVTTTNAPTPADRLPIRSWAQHDDDGLTAERVAALLDRHGPCVAFLWTCPWYWYFNVARDGGTLVYRGCGRNEDDRLKSEKLYGQRWEIGWHAVVCFAYRFCGEEMHVLVLDNQDLSGPRRWVHVHELHGLHTISV